MQKRQAKQWGMSFELYLKIRRIKAELRAQRQIARDIIAVARSERRAKREDRSEEEKRAELSAKTSAYIMKRYYSEPAFRAHVVSNSNRNSAKRRGAVILDPVSLDMIAERDNNRCHICGKKVSPQARSLDHLVPLSKGGQHTSTNLSLAHRSCNSRRGAGRTPAQLLLIGQ